MFWRNVPGLNFHKQRKIESKNHCAILFILYLCAIKVPLLAMSQHTALKKRKMKSIP